MRKPGTTAVGTWSGGRFMHFGEEISEERLEALVCPGGGIDTVLTADAYGAGAADELLGRALESTDLSRDEYCVIGAVGHDFYEGERQGAKGFPRFTDPALRGPDAYLDYLRMATERSLERTGLDRFDALLLHNPDQIGFTSEVVWDGMRALRDEGLTGAIGIAPGPANGFTLDVIDCVERFGSDLDYAMLILNPLEPWPGELALGACEQNGVEVITRVVDYGGLFWDDLTSPEGLGERDHRAFRPDGWIESGRERIDEMRSIAKAHDLTLLQAACQWNLAQPAVSCVAPTLVQEAGPDARTVESKREELAALPAEIRLSPEEIEEIRRIGDNHGCMALKGASPVHEGEERPDGWQMRPELTDTASRWGIDPDRDLVKSAPAPAGE